MSEMIMYINLLYLVIQYSEMNEISLKYIGLI